MEDPIPVQGETCSTSAEGSQDVDTHAAVESQWNNHGSDPSAGRCRPPRSIIDVPLELLVIIFQSFLPSVNPTSLEREGTCRSYMKGLYSLRLVSRKWRDLLDNFPSFWVVLTSTVPHIVNHTSIIRSGNAPLILHSGNPVWVTRGLRRDASLEQFIELVGPTRQRWKVLWVGWPYTETIWEYLASPAPMIETLRLPGNHDSPITLELLGNETHNIRHLDLVYTKIHWVRSMFSGLKYLRLCGCGGEGLTTDVILNTLANSPELEDLNISSMNILKSDTSFNPIVLPHLLSIKFDLPGDLVHYFLRHIEVPHCQRIQIQTTSGSEPDQLLEQFIVSFESLFRDLHKESGGSQLSAQSGMLQWYAGGTNPSKREQIQSCFVVRTSLPSFAPMLRWIERVFDRADPEGLEVTIRISGETDLQNPEITSVLRRLRSVTTLCASHRIRNSRETVGLLRNVDHNLIPVFPMLKILRVFCNDVTPEEILEMVQNRFNAHPDSRKPSDLEIKAMTFPVGTPNMPVESLNFAVITQIRSIAGVRFTLVRRRPATWRSGMLALVWHDERGTPAWG